MGIKGAIAAGAFKSKVNNMVPSRISQNQTFKGGLQDFSGQFGRNFEKQPRGTSMDQAKMKALVGTATSKEGMSAMGQMGKGALEEGGKYLGEQLQSGLDSLAGGIKKPAEGQPNAFANNP